MPAAAPPVGLDAGGALPVARTLSLLLSCPQCGGPASLSTDAVSFTCPHCASFLVVAHPGREAAFTCERTVPTAEEVRKIIILYRVQSHRAEVVARWGEKQADGSYRPPSESLIERELRKFEERLQAELQVRHAFCVHVPYWHISGSILQAILGREHGGPKEVRLRSFLVEHTVPAYDEARVNLRDRGLRMAGSRLQPLTQARARALGAFLAWHPVQDRTYLEIRKWIGRDLTPEIDPVTRQGAFAFAQRYLVYRPYWLASVHGTEDERWVLVDGTFGTIAGYPDPTEVTTLRQLAGPDPQTDDHETSAVVKAPRCPDCGADQQLDARAHVAICPNCHLALTPTVDGLKVTPYAHGSWGQTELDGRYLPFWSFEFSITPAGVAPITTLEDYAKALFPQGAPPGFAPRGGRLFVPAFRLLGTEMGDAVFNALTWQLHEQPPDITGEKVPVGGRPVLHDVRVPESEAREIARFSLWALHGRPSAARLNTLLVRRLVEQPALELTAPLLVMVPFTLSAAGLRLRDAHADLPRLIVDGGPELDAMRATVYQPKPVVRGA